MVEFTIRVVVLAACLYKVQNLLKIIKEELKIFLYMDKMQIQQQENLLPDFLLSFA